MGRNRSCSFSHNVTVLGNLMGLIMCQAAGKKQHEHKQQWFKEAHLMRNPTDKPQLEAPLWIQPAKPQKLLQWGTIPGLSQSGRSDHPQLLHTEGDFGQILARVPPRPFQSLPFCCCRLWALKHKGNHGAKHASSRLSHIPRLDLLR